MEKGYRNGFSMIRKMRAKALGAWTNSTFWLYVATLVRTMSWKVVLALALTLCLSATQGAQLLLLVPLMQLVGLDVQQGSIGWLAELVSSIFAAIGVRPTLITVLGAFVLFSTSLALITRWQMISNGKLQQDFVASLRRRLYRAIANTRWLSFSRSRSSDFTHALTTELDRVGQATFFLLRLVTNSILACVYVLLALRLSALLTALVFVSGVGLLLLLKSKARVARWTGEDVSLATNGLYAAAIEHLAGMKTAKSYGVEERNADIFSKLADRVGQMYLNGVRNMAGAAFWFSAGSVVTLSVILFVSVEILEISTAELLLLLFLFYRIIPLFNQGQESFQQFLNALPAFARVMEVQARCEAAAEPKAERSERVELRQGIRFEGVSFAYEEEGKPFVISDLDLSIRAGETTAIVGPSGAGKSTVADLVMGLIVPGSGEVLVDETPLSAERMRGWRGQIGYVVQDTFLFHDTVRANLLWAYPDASDEEMHEALRLAAAEDFVFELPKGMETILGDRGVRLSGGERQRLALARALLRKPSLLILDEATSNLDSENEIRIQRAIEKLHGSMTILIITHRLFAIRSADVIHVLEQGRLVESGDRDTLMARENGRFLALSKAQSTDTGTPRQ
jgi:ATP-binding cassette, subfamily C, bacterial